jgi:hypothetical protein
VNKLDLLDLLRSYERALHTVWFSNLKVSVTGDETNAHTATVEGLLQDLLDDRNAISKLIESRLDELRRDAAEEAKITLLRTTSTDEIRAWADELLVREVMES